MKLQIYNENISAFVKYFSSEKLEILIFFQRNVFGDNRSRKMDKNVNFKLVIEIVTIKQI